MCKENSKMITPTSQIGFIGGGRIAQAMAQGFIAAGEFLNKNLSHLINII